MKKIINYLFITGVIFTLVPGCKGKEKVENDPRSVVTAFFERMSKKDLDGAAKLATKDSKTTIDLMKKAMDAAEKMGMDKDSMIKNDDPTEEFKKMVIGEAKINGDNATVAVTNTVKDNKMNEFPLKKEGGEWKVDFSMATLMKMGMDKTENTGTDENKKNDTDTTGTTDEMKDLINSDSLKKGLNDLDSVLKELDHEKLKEALKELDKIKQ